jgi:hypothetical protein
MSGPPKPRTLLLAQIITTFFISLVMSGLITGMKAGFTLAWLKWWPLDWLLIWPMVFVLVRVFGPLGMKMAIKVERHLKA